MAYSYSQLHLLGSSQQVSTSISSEYITLRVHQKHGLRGKQESNMAASIHLLPSLDVSQLPSYTFKFYTVRFAFTHMVHNAVRKAACVFTKLQTTSKYGDGRPASPAVRARIDILPNSDKSVSQVRTTQP